jgi:hypothetical protein
MVVAAVRDVTVIPRCARVADGGRGLRSATSRTTPHPVPTMPHRDVAARGARAEHWPRLVPPQGPRKPTRKATFPATARWRRPRPATDQPRTKSGRAWQRYEAAAEAHQGSQPGPGRRGRGASRGQDSSRTAASHHSPLSHDASNLAANRSSPYDNHTATSRKTTIATSGTTTAPIT